MRTLFFVFRQLNCWRFTPSVYLLFFGHILAAQTDSLPNRLSVGYDIEKHPNFKGYLATLEYARKTSIGTAIAKVQNGSRFNQSSWIGQAEMYPKFGKKSYGYASLMLSDGKIFPKFSAAAHFMPLIKRGVELELGGRFIFVNTNEKAWLGILGMTKYWRNWLFSPKVYLVSGTNLSGQTAMLTVRRYSANEVSYVFLNTGLSNTNQTSVYQNLLFSTFQLNARWLQVGVHQKINKHWAIDYSGGFENFENANAEIKTRWLGSSKLNYIF